MKTVKIIPAVVLILFTTLIANTANADALDDVKQSGELVVGTEMQFAPFDFIQNGQHTGMNLDVFTEIGKELGVNVRFMDLPWSSVLPGLTAKNFDIVGGPLIVTKARKKVPSRSMWVQGDRQRVAERGRRSICCGESPTAGAPR